MSDTRVFMGSMVAGLAAIGAAWFLYHQGTQSALAGEDGPGPNLVIQVSGEKANGPVVIDLLPDIAPKHVAQIVELARTGAYDNVVFHRVLDGFMAQTGDVQYGKAGGDLTMAGSGKSGLPDIPAEFSGIPFLRGVVGMARSMDEDSANSQFFIMFAPAPFLDGQYTVVGEVTSGMDVVDKIARGEGQSGAVANPDYMTRVTVK